MWLRARLAGELATLVVALQFLTRLPLPDRWTPDRMARATRWFALAGALVGLVAAAVYLLAAAVFPDAVAAVLALGAGMVLTGALHEDGLADLCDGLGAAPGDRQRMLAIMRDSRLGTHGALGLGVVLGALALALAALDPPAAAVALVAGHGLSRASACGAMCGASYVRGQGAAAGLRAGPGPGDLAVLAATGALLALLLAAVVSWAAMAAGLAGLAVAHLLTRRVYERRLGGYTGDCLGAVQQTGMLGLVLGVLAAA